MGSLLKCTTSAFSLTRPVTLYYYGHLHRYLNGSYALLYCTKQTRHSNLSGNYALYYSTNKRGHIYLKNRRYALLYSKQREHSYSCGGYALLYYTQQTRHRNVNRNYALLYPTKQTGPMCSNLNGNYALYYSTKQTGLASSAKLEGVENQTALFLDLPSSCVRQLQQAETETDVFGLIERRSTPLTCLLASTAVIQLWHIQRERPKLGRSVAELNTHVTYKELLQNLEKDVSECDNDSLTSALYSLLHLGVDGSSAVIQRLIQEAHRRMHHFELSDLGKFASSLRYLGLYNSSAIGEIADILKRRLDDVTADDIQSFSTLMNAVMEVSTRSFQDQLMRKALQLLKPGCQEDGDLRRILSAVTSCQTPNIHLINRCMDLLQEKLDDFDVQWLYKLYRSSRILVYDHQNLKIRVLARVEELVMGCKDTDDLSKLYDIAINYGAEELTDSIEKRVVDALPDMTLGSVIRLCYALKQSTNNYRSQPLIGKLTEALQAKLPEATQSQVLKISKHGMMLRHLTSESVCLIRSKLMQELKDNINPHNVSNIITSLSLLPVSLVDCNDVIIKKVKNSYNQYDFKELSKATKALQRIVNHRHVDPQIVNKSKFRDVIQELSLRSLDLLQRSNAATKNSIDRHPENGFLAWTEIPQVANFLFYNRYRFTNVLDYISEILPRYTHKMSLSQLESVISAYSGLDYQTANMDEVYQACIQQCITNLNNCWEPCMVVSVMYYLALAQYYPKTILNAIFSLEFLKNLDEAIEHLPDGLGNSIQHKLLELNRCVRLECPDLNIPWFHDNHGEVAQRGKQTKSAVLDDIEECLSNALGGPQFLRKSVLTPYMYSLSFETILSSDNTPLICSDYGSVLNVKSHTTDNSHWGVQTQELPAGAQRVAIDYRGARHYCVNAYHPLGSQQMKRRHLEILGYRYVTIPHFEWNSMALSSKEDYENYIRNKIFSSL